MSATLKTLREAQAIEYHRAKSDFGLFTQAAWDVLEPHTDLQWNWHHDLIAEYLEACGKGQIKRLIINISPRSMKSLEATVCFPDWVWTTKPHKRFLFGSYADSLATTHSVLRRNLIESDWYQSGYGDMFSLSKDSNQKSEFKNDKTGHMKAAGIKGSITGEGGDIIIIDDPHNPLGAESQVEREKTLQNFDLSWSTRLNDKKNGCIIIIMQRLHEKDLTGHLIAKDVGYEHLKIPSICEKPTTIHFPMSGKTMTRDVGDIMHPERDGKKELRQARTDLGSYGFAGQHQQEPKSTGGNLIKSAHFIRYKVLPEIKYRNIYADTAQKTKEANDYSVFECWGEGVDGRIYLLDMIRGKWEAPELKKRTIAFWAKHAALYVESSKEPSKLGQLRKLKVEDKSSGTGLIQSISVENSIPVEGIQRDKDKLTRLMDVLPSIEAGLVCIPEDAPFTNDFIDECEAFRSDMTHSHDDQIDPMMDAINDMISTKNKTRMWEKLAE